MIGQVRTVCGDIHRRFDNLSGSHYHSDDDFRQLRLYFANYQPVKSLSASLSLPRKQIRLEER